MATLEENLKKFMTQACRPYNLGDIQTFLKASGDYGKTEVQRTIDKMVKDGRLVEKTYGKQKVYVIQQSDLPVASPAEMQALENNIKQVENELKENETKHQELQRNVKALLSTLTDEQMKKEIATLTQEINKLNTLLKGFDTTVPVDPVKRKQTRIKREELTKKWRSLKRPCMELVSTVLENYPDGKKALLEEMRIETDEEMGVSMSN